MIQVCPNFCFFPRGPDCLLLTSFFRLYVCRAAHLRFSSGRNLFVRLRMRPFAASAGEFLVSVISRFGFGADAEREALFLNASLSSKSSIAASLLQAGISSADSSAFLKNLPACVCGRFDAVLASDTLAPSFRLSCVSSAFYMCREGGS